MPFEFTRLDIRDVFLVEAKSFPDDRGFFKEAYKKSDFHENGIAREFVQDNVSMSKRGVLRGLHYQMTPMAQGKLVSVLQGEIYDVAVDIRRGSPTYGQAVTVTLRAEEDRMLYVPEGFAHGFQALTEGAQVWYKATSEYAPELDRGISYDDPELGIDWPIQKPILSKKDRELPGLADAENNFVWQGERE